VREALNTCDFVAIDTELTGLVASRQDRSHPLDSVHQRYTKLRESAAKFMTIQWGLCTFTRSPSGDEYVARPFNFFVFPKPFYPNDDYTFLCSVSSMHFLAGNKFDFNKLVYHGIPWLQRDEEQMIRASRAQDKGAVAQEDIALGEKEKAFVEDLCNQIDSWIDKSEDHQLQLKPCNSFLRRIAYQEIAKRYPDLLRAETHSVEGSQQRYIAISRKNKKEQPNEIAERQSRKDAELEEAIGFRRVIDALVEAKKPIVGHNMLLDLIHTFSFLFSTPNSSDQFKEELHRLFPIVMDTKYIVSNVAELADKCASTALGDTFSAFNKEQYLACPSIILPEGFMSYQEDESRLHEAGFDAYVTGVAYLRMAYQIGVTRGKGTNAILPGDLLMEDFANKIFLLRSDIPFFNLVGADPEPDRAATLYVFNFDPSLKTGDIVRHFSSFGQVYVSWVDETSLFLTLADKNLIHQALDHLVQTDPGPPFDFMQYADYLALRAGDASPLITKKRKRTEPVPPVCSQQESVPLRKDEELEEGEIEETPDMDGETSQRQKRARIEKDEEPVGSSNV